MVRDDTAGLIVIGNELLSGKVVDTNSAFLAQQLRSLGVTLRRMVVIPDEVEIIGAEVQAMRATVDVLFTSGGVGPTHDDVTIAGVARGLGRPVVRHPTLERTLRDHFGDTINDAHLKLAEVVEGTELEYHGNRSFPTFRVENIYILPGIPEIFRDKVLALRPRFTSHPFHLRVVYSREGESSIAAHLNRTLEQFPDLLLGSYPTLNDPEYRVRITLESKDLQYVERALAALLTLMPPSAVVRTE
jgi:molybdenum cofactor synthesis domain-containing protein